MRTPQVGLENQKRFLRQPHGDMSDARLRSPLHVPFVLRIGLVGTALVATLVVGLSGLVYPSPILGAIVPAVVTLAVTLLALFNNPVWAIYVALFVVLLPIGLIPPDLHSIFNRSMTVVASFAWLFDVLVRHRRVQWTSTSILMLGFIVWGGVTLLWAGDLNRGMTILQTYVLRFIVFLFLIPNLIRTRENLNGLMTTLALIGWLLMAVSAGTILIQGYQHGMRFKVLEMNENELGILAMVTMIGVLWQTTKASGRLITMRNLMASIFMAMSLGLVAMSGSRGSAISMILTLLIFLFSKPTRPWGILGLCILALGAIIAPLIFSAVLERFTVVRGDTLLGGREMYWHATWNLILDQPLKGVGLGNAPLALIPYLGSLAGVIELEKLSIHNPTLAIWSETGFPGLILYLSVLASAVWLFVRQYQKSGRPEMQWLMPYFALVSAVFLGFIASWAKGGGMETAFTYFLMLSFLLIPCVLEPKDSENSNDGQTLGIGTGRIEGGV